MTGINFRQFPSGCLESPCLPDGYTLVSVSSSRGLSDLPGIKTVNRHKHP